MPFVDAVREILAGLRKLPWNGYISNGRGYDCNTLRWVESTLATESFGVWGIFQFVLCVEMLMTGWDTIYDSYQHGAGKEKRQRGKSFSHFLSGDDFRRGFRPQNS
jgi:hypothetical protein